MKAAVYSAYEVWSMVPDKDPDNLAHKEEWVTLETVKNLLDGLTIGANSITKDKIDITRRLLGL